MLNRIYGSHYILNGQQCARWYMPFEQGSVCISLGLLIVVNATLSRELTHAGCLVDSCGRREEGRKGRRKKGRVNTPRSCPARTPKNPLVSPEFSLQIQYLRQLPRTAASF